MLRPAHLAYYKTSAEYQLLRLLELSDVHSCTQVLLKKHENTFGLVSPVRTFYLQAKTPNEVKEWVDAIDEARQALMATSTQNSVSSPIAIPNANRARSSSRAQPPPITPSPPPSQLSYSQNITSSDSEDASSPGGQRTYSASSQQRPSMASSPGKGQIVTAAKDPAKMILSGYLMKCGSKRRNWRKRWFVLTGEKLVYAGSHMVRITTRLMIMCLISLLQDTKPHRQFPFAEVLDALEYDLPTTRVNPSLMSPAVSSPPTMPTATSEGGEDIHAVHTFKIVTTKRTLLLCAPNEEEEIKWLGAIRALIARRTGTGAVPGESKMVASQSSGPAVEHAPGPTVGPSGGIRARVRRLSANGSSTGYSGGVIPQEGAVENHHP